MLFWMNVMLREAQKTAPIMRTNGNSLPFGLGNKEPVCANAAPLCRDDVLLPLPGILSTPRDFHIRGAGKLQAVVLLGWGWGVQVDKPCKGVTLGEMALGRYPQQPPAEPGQHGHRAATRLLG